MQLKMYVFIPVTRRVKGNTRFVGKYVTGRRKRFLGNLVLVYHPCSVRVTATSTV